MQEAGFTWGNAISAISAGIALIGGVVAFVSFLRTAQWKRAELASSFLKELNTNSELVFACRALDWEAGQLIIPENLRPLFKDNKVMDHSVDAMREAMTRTLLLDQVRRDPRLQIYRMALDSLLSWLSLVSSALDRGLFRAEDVDDLRYWVDKIKQRGFFEGFIETYGYKESTEKLRSAFHRPGANPQAAG